MSAESERAQTGPAEEYAGYRRFFEVSPIGVFINVEGKVALANPRAAELLGAADPRMLEGRAVLDLIHPDSHPLVEKRIESLHKTGAPVPPIVEKFIRLDGRPIDVEVTAAFLEYHGKPAIEVLFQDIGEQLRLRRERERAGELSEALNRINGLIHSVLDFDEIIKRVGEEGRLALGAEDSVVWLRDGGEWVAGYVQGVPAGLAGSRFSVKEAAHLELAAATKKPVVIEDARSDRRIGRPIAEKFGLRSVLIVPLIVRDESIGAVGLSYHTVSAAYSPAEIDFAEKLASAVSLAIENAESLKAAAEAQAEAQAELEVSNLLLEAANTLAKPLELDEILNRLADLLVRFTGKRRVTISLIDREKGDLVIAASRGVEPLAGGFRRRLGSISAAARRVLETGRAVLIDYEQPDVPPETRDLTKAFDMRLALVVPLALGGRPLGLIAVDEPGKRGVFSADEKRLLDGTAAQAAVAIDRAVVYEAEQEGRRLADVLNLVNAALTSTLDVAELMQGVTVYAAQAVGAEAAVIELLEGEEWTIRYAYGLPDSYIGRRLTPKSDIAELAVGSRRVLYMSDVAQDDRIDGRLLAEQGIGAVLAAPLVVRDKVFGCLILTYSVPVELIDARLDFVQKLAGSVSIALENAQLHQRTQRELTRTALLKDVAAAAAAAADIDQLSRRMLETLRRRLGVRMGAIHLIDEPQGVLRLFGSFGYPEPGAGQLGEISLDNSSEAGRLVLGRRPLATSDSRRRRPPGPPIAEADRENNRWVILTIMVRNRSIGTMTLAFAEKRPFTENELALYQSIAEQLGLAVDRQRLFQSQKHIAGTLQQALLTVAERVQGVDFGHIYRSATIDPAEVGGDFYDVFELEKGKVGLLIGDIAGKGLEAATLTALARNVIKAYAHEAYSPGRVLSKTNDMLTRQKSEKTFATAFFAILDLPSGELLYANAGHPPPLIRRRGGELNRLASISPAAGVFAGLRFEERADRLTPGDVIVAFTDGVTEARDTVDLYGEDRLSQLIQRLPAFPIEELPHRMMSELTAYSHGKLADDAAIIAVTPREDGS
jgi:PAS domain S-box-containing protein